MKRGVISLALGLLLLVAPFNDHADALQNKGLLITPLRTYTSLNAGSQKTNNFTIANLTSKTITVYLSVKQFSVSDYDYSYNFSDPSNNWLTLPINQVSLKSGESHSVSYNLNVPSGTAPGGHYYTLFASANLDNGGIESTVQAATLLYLTVNGTVVRTSQFVGSSIARVSFGKQITYSLDVKNTGNIHYYGYFSGGVSGLFVHPNTTGNSHLLLPGAIRKVTSSIPSPALPGIYHATYGYVTDSGTTVTQHRYVVFIPPWSIAFALLALMGGFKLYRRQTRKRTKPVSTPTEKAD